jgi:hypothetical protein
MAGINDFGLPQGLPEMLGGTSQKLSDWYDTRNAYTQDYANRLQAHLSNSCARPREMTAADLGLFWTKWVSDAPYSFWLGAQAETPVPGDIVQLRMPA